jgi:hypothetical protein
MVHVEMFGNGGECFFVFNPQTPEHHLPDGNPAVVPKFFPQVRQIDVKVNA